MPVDPQAQRLMAMLGAGRRPDAGIVTIEDRRRSFAALMRMAGRPPAVESVEDARVAGGDAMLPARVYRPAAGRASPHPGLVYFHGGGLVAGDLDTHDMVCRGLAAGSGCIVVAVGYRLAPEWPFPAAVEDAEAALADVLDRASTFGLDPDRIGVGGDSAGATLAILAASALRARAGPVPVLQLLLCPVLDIAPETESRRAFGAGYLLDAALMERDLADYLPGTPDLDDPSLSPRLSPLRAPDLAGAPRALIHTAEFDPLRDEGALYAARLAAAGVAVEHRCHPGMIHHFYGLTGFIPAARLILADIAAELGAALRS